MPGATLLAAIPPALRPVVNGLPLRIDNVAPQAPPMADRDLLFWSCRIL